jgi:putative component of toxin-antitoxin plasmid stabilization module
VKQSRSDANLATAAAEADERLMEWLRGLRDCHCRRPIPSRLYRTVPGTAGNWSCAVCSLLIPVGRH